MYCTQCGREINLANKIIELDICQACYNENAVDNLNDSGDMFDFGDEEYESGISDGF